MPSASAHERFDTGHHPMHDFMSALTLRAMQTALLPVSAIGYVSLVTQVVHESRTSGVSATALASLYTRYMQHALGTRRDDAAAQLMLALPSVPSVGLALCTAPTLLAHSFTGYVPRVYRYPYPGEPPMLHQSAARTTFYDQVIARYLNGFDQLVILGAGFDTRAYRFPAQSRVRCFELDEPQTLAQKRAILKAAHVDAARVAYVPADFEQDDWVAQLTAAGFDPRKPSVFTWESVAMYLDRATVERTLRTIASLASGTVLAFDYVSADLLRAPTPFVQYARVMTKATGEPWKFGIDGPPPSKARVRELLASSGLKLAEQRNFGHESAHKPAPAGFAVARVP